MSSHLGRRQSSRAVRSTATRPNNYYATAALADEAAQNPDRQPGFFPAITHFTDAVDALPREVMRHFSLMKEVEAKAFAPDEDLLTSARQFSKATMTQSDDQLSQLQKLGYQIAMMSPLLDEKISVLSTANSTLSRQLEVMKSSYKHIPDELSLEARYGSTNHWAYVAEKETKKPTAERSRREAAAANTFVSRAHDFEATSRKSRNQQVDSDFEERPGRKSHAKTRKPEPAPAQSKRKRPAAAPAVMERSISAVFSHAKAAVGSPNLGSDSNRKRKAGQPAASSRKRCASSKFPPIFSSLTFAE